MGTLNGGRPDVWQLPNKPESIPVGRRRIAELAKQWLGNEEAADDAELCASELLTNAHNHGAGPYIRVTITVTDAVFRIAVHDDGGTGWVAPPRQDGRRTDYGRGLFLVKSLASRWGISKRQGTTVWFQMGLPQTRAAAPSPCSDSGPR